MPNDAWYMILYKKTKDVFYAENLEDATVFVNDKARKFDDFIVEKVPKKLITSSLINSMESRSLAWALDGDRVLSPDEITDFENLYDQMSYLVSKMKYAVEDLSKLKLEEDDDIIVRKTMYKLYNTLDMIADYDFYCQMCEDDDDGYSWYKNFNNGYLLDTIIRYYTGCMEGT